MSQAFTLCCCCCVGLQNELSILEFIHNLVETLDKYFENVCELDVRHNTHTQSTRPLPLPTTTHLTRTQTADQAVPALTSHHLSSPCVSVVAWLQLMFNLERAHFILDEMVMSGRIVELNKQNILKPIRAFDMLEAQEKK